MVGDTYAAAFYFFAVLISPTHISRSSLPHPLFLDNLISDFQKTFLFSKQASDNTHHSSISHRFQTMSLIQTDLPLRRLSARLRWCFERFYGSLRQVFHCMMTMKSILATGTMRK
jgi:hypothetical protein